MKEHRKTFDKFNFEERKEKLLKLTQQDAEKLIYEWTVKGLIGLREFKELNKVSRRANDENNK